MKLYNINKNSSQSQLALETKQLKNVEEPMRLLGNEINDGIVSLEHHLKAHASLSIIENHITLESFSFIDKGNYVLYNEYIKSVTSNLGLKYIPTLAQETVSLLPNTALNHHIALEGFVKDMWEKIKTIFMKVYNTIKEFFKRWFTRLGRIKGKLNNIKEAVSSTKTDLKTIYINEVPSSITSNYPVKENISSLFITSINNNVDILVKGIESINAEAKKVASEKIMDPAFVSEINKFRDIAKGASDTASANEKDKKDGVKTLPLINKFTDDGKHNAAINKENASLKELAEDSTASADKLEDSAKDLTKGEDGSLTEDAGADKAKARVKAFMDVTVRILDKVKGKPLAKGKTINKVTASVDSGLELDISDDKETPAGVSLADKESLLKLTGSVIDMISHAETLAKSYGEINDTLIKNMSAVDSIINEIDSFKMDSLGKYKSLLQNQIKVRLSLAKEFFSTYNKFTKNVLEMAMDAGDGVVAYATISLKHYG